MRPSHRKINLGNSLQASHELLHYLIVRCLVYALHQVFADALLLILIDDNRALIDLTHILPVSFDHKPELHTRHMVHIHSNLVVTLAGLKLSENEKVHLHLDRLQSKGGLSTCLGYAGSKLKMLIKSSRYIIDELGGCVSKVGGRMERIGQRVQKIGSEIGAREKLLLLRHFCAKT